MNSNNHLSHTDIESLNEATYQQLYAAQLIALTGRHLIPQEIDDSNTNMKWNDRKTAFIGNLVDASTNFHVCVNIANLSLIICDEELESFCLLELSGNTFDEAFDWLKKETDKLKPSNGELSKELHYELPKHELLNGATFNINNSDAFTEWVKYRSFAEFILQPFVEKFDHASSVRIWPHHFDTGSYIPIAFNDSNEAVKSIGIGLTIADAYVDEPYLYVNQWSAKGINSTEQLPGLSAGGEWNSKDWTGAFLRMSTLQQGSTVEDQFSIAHEFFTSGINSAMLLIQ